MSCHDKIMKALNKILQEEPSKNIFADDYLFHIGSLGIIQCILQFYCFYCSKQIVKISKNEENLSYFDQMELIRTTSKNKIYCTFCNKEQPKYQRVIEKATGIICIEANTSEMIKKFHAIDVFNKFREIETEEFESLKKLTIFSTKLKYIKRPENLLVSTSQISIPPIQIRPSVRGDFGNDTSIENSIIEI
jgi:RNA polymerase Rpb1, domain 1